MIETVLFDLDNTLLDFDRAEHEALRQTLLHLCGYAPEELLRRYNAINRAQWKLLEQGKLTRHEVKLRRFALLFDEFDIRVSVEKAAREYEALLGIGHYYMEGAEEVLKTLAPCYGLYIVTNGTASVQQGRIGSAGLRQWVRDIFISEEIGFDKPNPAYFEACFARIPGLQRQKTVIVGDSLSSDIQGGKNAGIGTIWFHPGKTPRENGPVPDHEIAALRELEPLLRMLSIKK